MFPRGGDRFACSIATSRIASVSRRCCARANSGRHFCCASRTRCGPSRRNSGSSSPPSRCFNPGGPGQCDDRVYLGSGSVHYSLGTAYGAPKASLDKMAYDIDFADANRKDAPVSIWMRAALTERLKMVIASDREKFAMLEDISKNARFTGDIMPEWRAADAQWCAGSHRTEACDIRNKAAALIFIKQGVQPARLGGTQDCRRTALLLRADEQSWAVQTSRRSGAG